MHNDEMATASYMGRRIGWEVRVGGGHSAMDGQLAVDLSQLYESMLNFLALHSEQARRKRSTIWVRESFRFNREYAQSTRKEILRLGKK
jgi:hypothetical protein